MTTTPTTSAYTKTYVKEGEETLSINGVGTDEAVMTKVPLYVRNGKVAITNSNIITNPTVDGTNSLLSVGGYDAELVLDGTTYLNRSLEAGDGTQDNGAYINVGGPDGIGTLTLKNNSVASTRYSMFVGRDKDESWHDTYAMSSTTTSPDSTERYSAGTYTDSFGAGIVADTWTLVGISFKAGTDAASGAKYIAGTANSNFYTRNLGGFDTPAESDQTFAIGSGNSGDAREVFNGQIAGLTIFTSDSVIGGVNDITAIMGTTAPVMEAEPTIPEPTTATLSLLALAGLAARRRRK